MSKRNPLRELIRKIPTRPEIETILDNLRSEPDLTAVIIGTAIVEATLERLLTSKFSYENKNLIGQIFLNRGPLMDFHSKILIAHAFDVITPRIADHLHSIKSIRNVFAHSKVPVNFSTTEIVNEVQSMRLPKEMAKAVPFDDHGYDEPRRAFLLVVRLMITFMEYVEDSPYFASKAFTLALNEDDAKRASKDK